MKQLAHCEREEDGLLIYEENAGRRVMSVYGEVRNGYAPVKMPHMIFVVRYLKTCNLKHMVSRYGVAIANNYKKLADLESPYLMYPGVCGYGLRVYTAKEPLKSINDTIFTMPTDPGGVVCTDHHWDYSFYKTPDLLAKTAINLWYSLTHSVNCLEHSGNSLGPLNMILSGPRDFTNIPLCFPSNFVF